ncbi:MAG: UDP-N-acetylmuramoyl-L-alanine--D-glutamate ligase [Lachnospiraceae bacterium]|nr:UDP-N-acetylmuramoyl-L-alanine--D-glutamate ligase [Lachnospiraceae bacterium]
MKTYDKFDGKSILIWGYGREGKSTENFLKKCANPAKIDIFEGKRDELKPDGYDYIIKSPGIVMDDDPPGFTSQTDILLEVYKKNIIGVTGTKGKSTTSALLHHVLNECLDRDVILLGNIGKPCLDYFDSIRDDTIVVFEMSCHQLAHARYSPHIAVFLNIYEEHLDYYHTFDNYFRAKCNITANQTGDDILYIGDQVPEIPTEARKITVSRGDTPHFELSIPGKHNEYNAYVVFKIATEQFGIDPDRVREALKTFKGLPHRLCFIGEKDGIKYYDDSISTIPNATIEALEAIGDVRSVIIGGLDRGISYDILIDFIKAHDEYIYIFAYESGQKIYESVKGPDNRILVSDLKEAVEKAKSVTPRGSSCILSPAAASYGYFRDFEERGDRFREFCGL